MTNWWRILHWFIIMNFLLEIIYGFYMVFFGIGGSHRPLFFQAIELPADVFLRRRLFAIETWIGIAGLSIYLGITEILPKRFRELKRKSSGNENINQNI